MEEQAFLGDDQWDIEKAIQKIKRRKLYDSDDELNSDGDLCDVSEFVKPLDNELNSDSGGDSHDVSMALLVAPHYQQASNSTGVSRVSEEAIRNKQDYFLIAPQSHQQGILHLSSGNTATSASVSPSVATTPSATTQPPTFLMAPQYDQQGIMHLPQGNTTTSTSVSPPSVVTTHSATIQPPTMIVQSFGQIVLATSNNAQVETTLPQKPKQPSTLSIDLYNNMNTQQQEQQQHQLQQQHVLERQFRYIKCRQQPQLQQPQHQLQQPQQAARGIQTPSSPSQSHLMDRIFYSGLEFDSYKDVCTAREMYEEQNKIVLVKVRCPRIQGELTEKEQKLIYLGIDYICVHSGKYKRRSNWVYNEKKRKKTSSYKWECPFKMSLRFNKYRQILRVTQLHEEHNHICHSSIYDRYPKKRLDADTLEETKMLLGLNVDKKKVLQYLHSKGKMVNMKNLNNIMKSVDKKEQQHLYSKGKLVIPKNLHNLMKKEVKKSDSFEDVLALMMNHQDLSFEILLSNKSVCQGIFFQTEAMKLTFDAYSELIFVDCTYKLNEHRMPLYVMMCLDDNGKSKVIALALVQYENKETLSWIAVSFRKYNPNFMKVKFIMAATDMVERQVLLNHFPNAQLLTCQCFHILQTFKREVTTTNMEISAEEKDFSLEIIQNIVFAEDKVTCDTNITLLNEMAPKKVVDYFTKIWEPIKDDWVKCMQSQSLSFYQSANKLNIFNGKLKPLIQSYSSMTQFFTDLLTFIRIYECERNCKAFNTLMRQPTDILEKKQMESTIPLPTSFLSPLPDPVCYNGERNHQAIKTLIRQPTDILENKGVKEPGCYNGQTFTSYKDICAAKEIYETFSRADLLPKLTELCTF